MSHVGSRNTNKGFGLIKYVINKLQFELNLSDYKYCEPETHLKK